MMRTVHQLSGGSPLGAATESKSRAERDTRDELKQVREGLSEEDESRNDEAGLQQQRVVMVRWERFLPVRALKVLLVESDDSTRQLVSALLRNSSYEVTAAANGQQAWDILEDLTNHIDLILTEVVMPCMSGTDLLCKIMSHKTRKNIPVIMMSSNDSMHTVFNCLSKGAVDFLVKPIRKNELKNLWQHVWRRCHCASVSGSESGIQTEKHAKSKSGDDSQNSIGSNDEDDNGLICMNKSDGSDNGSGTQNSWTKRAVEVDSPRPMSPSDQSSDQHDSTCAQITHPKTESFCTGWVPMTKSTESKEQNELADYFMGKDLKIGVPRNSDTQHESYPSEKVSTEFTSGSEDQLPQSDPKNKVILGPESSNVSDKPSSEAADLIGLIANNTVAQVTTRDTDAPGGFSMDLEEQEMVVDGSLELPSLKLSLKRMRSTRESDIATRDGRNLLKRSDLSAFQRYHASATLSQDPTVDGVSCSPLDNSSEVLKTGSTKNVMYDSNVAPCTGSNGSNDNNDMGSSTKNAFAKPPTFNDKMVSVSAFKSVHSAFHPVQLRTSAQVVQEKNDDANVKQSRGNQHQIQMQHNHPHNHHRYIHPHDIQQMQVLLNQDAHIVKTLSAASPHNGPSIMLTGSNDGNAANYSNHGSNSGSNYGSNRENGSSTTVNAGGVSANGMTEINGASGGDGSGGCSRVEQDRFAQRVAALNKFRQKRKERNFEKKVRYHSRKRLAEQRPRMRGQFVRRAEFEEAGREADR